MKIVFLDFDGVLNAETGVVDDSTELWTAAWLEPHLVARLARLVERAAAKIVISSSWRQRRTLGELEEMLASHGYSGGILDVTPRLPRPSEGERLVRASEIAAWLAAHPEVEAFVILDDDRELGPLAHRHVWSDPAVGLSDADVERALNLLGRASQ